MRQVRVMEHISLDGVIAPEGPGMTPEYTHGGWMAPYRCPDGAAAVLAAQGEAFDLLLGRRTYDLWAGYWPGVTGGPFAGKINGATKYVVTHRPEGLPWGPTEGVAGDVVKRVGELKAGDGPDLILWGSATLVPVLLDAGLVDELVLFVYPVLLGRGKRPFGDGTGARGLELAETKVMTTGAVMSRYRCGGPMGTA